MNNQDKIIVYNSNYSHMNGDGSISFGTRLIHQTTDNKRFVEKDAAITHQKFVDQGRAKDSPYNN